MKKTLTLVGAAVALFMAQGPAFAVDNVFSFLAKGETPPGAATGMSRGAWTVTATQVGGTGSTTWKIKVQGNPLVGSPFGDATGLKFANQIHVDWFCCPDKTIDVLGDDDPIESGPQADRGRIYDTATNTEISGAGPPNTRWRGQIVNAATFQASVDYQHTGAAIPLGFDGTVYFESTVVLSTEAKAVSIRITDGTFPPGANPATWAGGTAFALCVPEPASISLAFAGLAPLAGALLKRRRRSSETEETEDTA